MKYLLAAIAIAALTTPSLAFDRDAYKAAKQEWHADWKETKSDWKDAGKPEPKPTRAPKPQKSDF
jgi:hypothetical protein